MKSNIWQTAYQISLWGVQGIHARSIRGLHRLLLVGPKSIVFFSTYLDRFT